ncbi:MAG: type I methionyl aminopeptidase [Planctomycetes bacterium]|nr:type I methionyl aminopeptidase [Planctomycetota bacterium]
MISIKSDVEFEAMRRAGRVVAEVLTWASANVRPGMTLAEIDAEVERIIRSRGATPEFKGYRGFPASSCLSVNEQVVHGIPSRRRLVEGDIVGCDVGARLDGFVGDAAVTIPVGKVSKEAQRLIDTCRECLDRAVLVCAPGARLSQIGEAVQSHAEARGYTLVREYAGHGIGRKMHEEPSVPNYVDADVRRHDLGLKPGMAICIEPMVNQGLADVRVLEDGWTVVTRDGKLSAHFEHTVAIRGSGAEVLTVL